MNNRIYHRQNNRILTWHYNLEELNANCRFCQEPELENYQQITTATGTHTVPTQLNTPTTNTATTETAAERSVNTCTDCEAQTDGSLERNNRIVCENCNEQYFTCEDCETDGVNGNDDFYSVDGGNRMVCESCYSDNYRTCDSCNEAIYYENITFMTNDTAYCEDCYSDNAFYCENCSEDFDSNRTNFNTIGDDTYCEPCMNDISRYCDSCNEYYLAANTVRCVECEEDYCDSCYEDSSYEHEDHEVRRNGESHRDTTPTQSPYREQPKDTFLQGENKGKYITIDRLVGIEIEAEEGNKSDLKAELPATVGISRDGSLDSTGVECQTPPASMDKLEEIITATCKGLKNKGFKGTKSCGLHVHVDARDIQKDHTKIVQVIKTFYAIEDILYSMLPPSRWGGHYCKQLNGDYLYKNFNKRIDDKKLSMEWYKDTNLDSVERRKNNKYDGSRYYGLNIHSLFYRGTIELRYHSGTVEERKIIYWANIMLHLIDYAINNYNEKTIQQFFDMETSYDKWVCFVDTFAIDNATKQYMSDRTNKFNPGWHIKFNKGKQVRTSETRQRAGSKKRAKSMVAKYRAELTQKLIEQNKQLAKRYETEKQKFETLIRPQLTNTKMDFETYIAEAYLDIARPRTPKELTEYIEAGVKGYELYDLPSIMKNKLKGEVGFLKKEELDNVLTLLRQGQQMATENQSTESADTGEGEL